LNIGKNENTDMLKTTVGRTWMGRINKL